MSCSRPRAGPASVQHFLGHHAGDEGHFDAVPQHVLAVAGAEVQPAQQVDQPLVQAVDGQFQAGLFADLLDVPLQLLLRGDTISSIRAGWMRPSAMSLFRASRATSRRIMSKR